MEHIKQEIETSVDVFANEPMTHEDEITGIDLFEARWPFKEIIRRLIE